MTTSNRCTNNTGINSKRNLSHNFPQIHYLHRHWHQNNRGILMHVQRAMRSHHRSRCNCPATRQKRTQQQYQDQGQKRNQHSRSRRQHNQSRSRQVEVQQHRLIATPPMQPP
mmetsp:Transcript_7017/g.20614  ORF Transcript_7017/g.20614 Transcript_7017/m.20614 type:complete len:112 (+) Transcript_7017:539-874(+)